MNLLEYLKQQKVVPQQKADKFIELLAKYEENDVLYSSALKDLSLTEDEQEALFVELEKENFVDSIFIMQCPFCDSMGNTYVEKFDIPDSDECRFCHEEYNHKENYILAYRIYFNYKVKVDIVSELSQKITYNQDRIFEITESIKEMELQRNAIQVENVKFVSLRNELLFDKDESKMYSKVLEEYKGQNVKYIGTLLYMKKCIVKCSKCNEAFELFDINNRIIGACPTCGFEIEFTLK
jgi:hypothetical protein